MPPTITVPIPAGSIGVAFKGTEPTITGLAPTSSMRGILKVGYQFIELILGDGAIMSGLDTHELIAALNQYSNDSGRKIRFSMSLPAESTIVLQSGAHGLVVEDKFGKATLTRIDYESALRKEIRVGMIVDSIELEDGSKFMGHSAEEVSNILTSSDNDSKRTLVLKSPDAQLSLRAAILPSWKSIDLPAGTTDEVGLCLTGEITTIASVDAGSPLFGKVRSGFIVAALKLPGNHLFKGFNATEMADYIDVTSAEYGRMLLLENPDIYEKPDMATAKIMLPNEGTLDDFKIMVTGSPATVKDIRADSPLKGLVNLGYTTYACGWGNGTEFVGLSAVELDEVLRDSSGLRGRYIVFASNEMKMPSSSMPSSSMPSGSMQSDSSNVVNVTLKPGSLGAGFKGVPPKLSRLSPSSPLNGLVKIGMTADTLTLADGTVMYDMETKEFTGALKQCANDPYRKIRFIDLDKVALTKEPGVADNSVPAESPGLVTVYLPTGKLSVKFKGTNCAIVSTVKDTSPLVGKLRRGMAVDRAVINGRDYVELGGKELAELLMSTSDIPGRSLKLRDSGNVEEFSKLPKEVELSLPTGKLGVTFAGKMPCAKSFKPDSPIASRMPPGMFVDKLKLPDGYIVSGFSSRELVGLLGQFSNVEGRVLVLKSMKTEKQSAKAESFPDEKEITLPNGRLGISFKGTSQSRVSRLHEESALLGDAYVGMKLDTIKIPGGNTFAGMTAKEAAKLLVETKDVQGRIMTLKSPDNNNMMPRNVDFDVSIGNSTAMSTEKSRRVG